MDTRVARRAQRQRAGKKRSGGASRPSRLMYYVFIGVSVLVALTMIIPTCSAFTSQPRAAPPATATR
jgi:hypothetical protein